jgi:hypothetical protein
MRRRAYLTYDDFRREELNPFESISDSLDELGDELPGADLLDDDEDPQELSF